MNSVIEAQITLEDETNKEIERCRNDPYYLYINYCKILVNGIETIPGITREQFEYYSDISNNKPKPHYHR